MKKMSDAEIQAFYNELEGMKQKLKLNLGKINVKLTPNIIKWINEEKMFSELEYSEKRQVIELLFNERKDRYYEEREVIIEALSLTTDPKLVEVSKKMREFSHKFPIYLRENMDLAELILNHSNMIYNPSFAPTTTDLSYRRNGKIYTIGKEITEIKKRNKKVRKNENKKIKKFINIYHINVNELYTLLINFLRKNDEFAYRLDDESLIRNMSDTILKNKYEAIRMFDKSDTLSFIHKQKRGKIK